jgi:hypothetical protein
MTCFGVQYVWAAKDGVKMRMEDFVVFELEEIGSFVRLMDVIISPSLVIWQSAQPIKTRP